MNSAGRGRRILVTGGAGYIGSHVVRRLAEGGDVPVVLDDLSTGTERSAAPASLHVGSVTDAPFLGALLRTERIEAVIHLAAKKSVEASVLDPMDYVRTNVVGSVALIDACLDAGVRTFVFSSSAAVYGAPQRLPVHEDDPTRPENPYGETKLAVERILDWTSRAGELQAISLRYFNAAGAAPDGLIGEPWNRATNLIPIVLRAAWSGDVVNVHGDDYPTRDGTAVRDYIHVSDLADAHVRALDYLDAGGEPTVLNLGTGSGASVQEVVETAREITGRPIEIRVGPRRAGDPPAVWADNGRARTTLGWSAGHELTDMIRSAWNWHMSAERRAHELATSGEG